MTDTTDAGATAPAYDDAALYEVDLVKVVNLGDMRLRPSHDNKPHVRGELLKTFPADAVRGAKRVAE